MKENRKKNIRVAVLILILFLGIGFAALTANLKINGTLNVSRTAWDVHFENVQITNGSVTANPAPTSDNTTTTEMTYTINFTKPGDFFEFTTDIVNDGTIDAMVDVVSNNAYATAASTTPISLPSYLTNTVTYNDGVPIDQNQLLAHGTSEKIKVRIEFKKDIQASDLPSSGDTSVIFKFKGDYKQADENAIRYSVYNPGDLVYFDPIASDICNENTFDIDKIKNGTSTCYKWRVIKVNDSKYLDKINIQLDHNLVNNVKWASISNSSLGPNLSLSTLASATSSWGRVEPIKNYSYDTTSSPSGYGLLNCLNGTCSISKNSTETQIATNVKARMITGEEISKIVRYIDNNEPEWNINYPTQEYYFSRSTKSIGKQLSWLIENTSENSSSGATINAYGEYNQGYWTLAPVAERNWNAWPVDLSGSLQYYINITSTYYGARPVIDIEKSKLN